MSSEAPLPLLVVILGPTASGKTALSVALAERFGGEIVSCDSVAVYHGLEIGSAKPSPDQRLRIPHHLVDVATPNALYTAGDYSRDARSAIAAIAGRGALPIVTGGSGLYLRALLQGLFPGPKRSQVLRDRLASRAVTRGPNSLHRILTRLDPASAARIHANDLAKVIRAVEVTLSSSQPMSEAWQEGRVGLTGYRILRIGLDPERQQLYARINARAQEMFARGLVEETEQLIARYGRTPVLSSLGYRQASQLLDGTLTLGEAIAAASQGHRNYAKRQLTWFRREAEVCWLHGFGDDHFVRLEAERLVHEAKS
ncbi:MAG: tRNA (adenosine(37)-N6)-dimethylallyltransferase MiaA [Acidobacteriaceae bacterium]